MIAILEESIPARVDRGAKALDNCHPGWAAKIDRRTLDLRSQRNDILGQLYGSYAAGVRAVWPSLSRDWHATRDFGFGLEESIQLDPECDRLWHQLKRRWLAAIDARTGQ